MAYGSAPEIRADFAVPSVEELAIEVERVDINGTGFMSLKKMMIERGVPEAEVKGVPNKFALKELAEKYVETCKLEFY